MAGRRTVDQCLAAPGTGYRKTYPLLSIPASLVRHTFGGQEVRYMLLIYRDEQAIADVEHKRCYQDSVQLAQELHANGSYIAASPLHPVATATSLRVRDGRPILTDGPFAETREQLGGYFLVNVNNLDDAISIAARLPGARSGTVEIRPILEIPGLPEH